MPWFGIGRKKEQSPEKGQAKDKDTVTNLREFKVPAEIK